VPPSPLKVILLTRDDCALCHDAEKVLARLSTSYDLEVVRIDLDTPEGIELATSGGVMFPPGIFIDGVPVSHGRPSERRLRRKLEALRDDAGRS
jgi:glutaredoxin